MLSNPTSLPRSNIPREEDLGFCSVNLFTRARGKGFKNIVDNSSLLPTGLCQKNKVISEKKMSNESTFAAKANRLSFFVAHCLVNAMAKALNAQHKNVGRERITLFNSPGQRERFRELLIP